MRRVCVYIYTSIYLYIYTDFCQMVYANPRNDDINKCSRVARARIKIALARRQTFMHKVCLVR